MSDYSMRQCTKCGNEYPLTKEYYQPAKGYKYGFNTQCRICRRKDAKNYPSAKSDKKKKYNSEYSKRPNVVKRRNDKRRNRYLNDIEFREYISESNKKTRSKNPEQIKTKKQDEYQRHKDKYSKSARKRYLNNRDIYLEKARNQKDDTVAHGIRVQRRLARKRNLPNELTKQQWLDCLEYWDNKCCICGRSKDKYHTIAMEHWIALSDNREENPGTAINNILPMCHSLKGAKGDSGCNNKKHKKDAIEWLFSEYNSEKAQQILNRIMEYFELKSGIQYG